MTLRWARGEFGNHIEVWTSLREFREARARGKLPVDTFTLRSYEPGSPYCTYNKQPEEIEELAAKFVAEGADPAQFYVNASRTIDEAVILQGEVQRGVGGLDLRYSRVKKKTRLALAEEEINVHGFAANVILRDALDPVAYDWLEFLLDAYPDHVVELSAFRVPLGVLKWNTIFWEVRRY